MNRLYVLLGGNLGDKKKIFDDTIRLLQERVGSIIARSARYETEPWGFESEDMFWNQVLEIETALLPIEVLHQTQQIEAALGRIRKTDQYSSRLIDIDILFYNREVLQLENLMIPHPRIQERKFVLVPLNEIAGEYIHPVFGKSVGALLLECTDQLQVSEVNDQLV